MLLMLNIDNLDIENLDRELIDIQINEFNPILERIKPLSTQDFYKKEEKMNEENNNIIIYNVKSSIQIYFFWKVLEKRYWIPTFQIKSSPGMVDLIFWLTNA